MTDTCGGTAPPRWLYHVTSTTRLAAILAQGLVPQPCRDGEYYERGFCRVATYLSDCPLTALDHADVVLDRLGGDAVLFRVAFGRLDPAALSADDYDIRFRLPGGEHPHPSLAGYSRWQDVPWQASLAGCRAVAYGRTIPPVDLTQVKLG